MTTRSALNAYQQGLESIVFDHYGTGDSEGELNQANLSVWQADIICLLVEIKNRSSLPIFLSISLSAALLINDDMLALIDGIIFVQAEFNGKRFVQQFKRLALAAELNKPTPVEQQFQSDEVAIAGYSMKKQLLNQLSHQAIENLSAIKQPYYWFEWQAINSELSMARANQYQKFLDIHLSGKNDNHFIAIDDIKYWQSTELEIAGKYLEAENSSLSNFITSVIGGKAC
jgi:exosortase A-associated hydrolase 2